MSTARELNNLFDQAEELVGTSPNSDDLRNAIHAVITKGHRNLRLLYHSVEYLARNYETMRTTTQTIG